MKKKLNIKIEDNTHYLVHYISKRNNISNDELIEGCIDVFIKQFVNNESIIEWDKIKNISKPLQEQSGFPMPQMPMAASGMAFDSPTAAAPSMTFNNPPEPLTPKPSNLFKKRGRPKKAKKKTKTLQPQPIESDDKIYEELLKLFNNNPMADIPEDTLKLFCVDEKILSEKIRKLQDNKKIHNIKPGYWRKKNES